MSSLHDVVKNRQHFPKEGCKLVFSQKDFLSANCQLIDTHLDTKGVQNTRMVELSGIEPLTPCLQSRCSPS